jgi:hypothetical protein
MAHLYALLAMTFAPFILGVAVSIFAHKVPKRGWVGLLLVLFSGLFRGLTEPSDNSAPERLWTLSCFTFFAPIAVIYAFRSRKVAPDRLLANAAFVGSFLVSAALLFMLFGSIYMAFTLSRRLTNRCSQRGVALSVHRAAAGGFILQSPRG